MSGVNGANNPSHNNPVSAAEAIMKNKHVAPGHHLGSAPEFFTLQVGADLTTAISGTSLTLLDKFIESVSLRGAPVIQGPVSVANGVSTIKFMTEHYGSWAVAAPNDLANTVAGALTAVVGSAVTVTVLTDGDYTSL